MNGFETETVEINGFQIKTSLLANLHITPQVLDEMKENFFFSRYRREEGFVPLTEDEILQTLHDSTLYTDIDDLNDALGGAAAWTEDEVINGHVEDVWVVSTNPFEVIEYAFTPAGR